MNSDYYVLLDISRTATTEEIERGFKKQFRLWSQRTNAPDLERRQEAERILQQLEEAKQILLDPSKRAEYDRQQKTFTTNTNSSQARTNSNTDTYQTETQYEQISLSLEELENRLKNEPNNNAYKLELAWAYLNSSINSWTYVANENLYYATEKSHVDEAKIYIQKAESLGCQDPSLAKEIQLKNQSINASLKRYFTGSHAVAILGGILYLTFIPLGLFLMASYYIVYRTPQYVINKQIFLGERTFEDKYFLANRYKWLLAIGVFFIPFLYPVLIFLAYNRNYGKITEIKNKLPFLKR